MQDKNVEESKSRKIVNIVLLRINDIVDIWLIEKKIDIEKLKLQEYEVAEVKYLSIDEIERLISSGKFVPTIEPSYYLVKNYINTYKRGKIF